MAHPISLTQASQIRVLAADSNRMNNQLLADVLTRDSRFRVMEGEPKADAIVAAAGKEMLDIVILSPALEEDSTKGFHVAQQLHAARPETRIIMLLDVCERGVVTEAFRCGARGIFCRSESLKLLAKCIECVHQGQIWASSSELRYLLEAFSQTQPMRLVDAAGTSILSRREQDVVRCVAEGLSNREIAGRLHLTEHTVKNYLFRIFDKLGVSSRVEVVLYAFSVGRSGPIASVSSGPTSVAGNGTRAKVTSKPASAEGSPQRRRQPGVAGISTDKEVRRVVPV